ELRGALSQRGKDRFRFRRVGDQSSREQANGEETTDGMEPAWSASPSVDKNPRTRRGVGEHLPALVSGLPPSSASQESGLTPENLPLSRARGLSSKWTENRGNGANHNPTEDLGRFVV